MIHVGGFSFVTLERMFTPLKPLWKLALVIGIESAPYLGNPLPWRKVISEKKNA